MKEKEFISVIKNVLHSRYIGDDCAYLEDLGIVVTQDSLVEGVHFRRDWMSARQLGFKSAAVNISDIAASGAKPLYMTVSLSLPADINKDFIKEFYEGAKSACNGGVEIVGGDITGADKIFISICAIGGTKGRNISSRSNAKIGQKIVVSGVHGSSAAGLRMLMQGKNEPQKLIKAHLEPAVQLEFSKNTSTQIKDKYAMTDTSDGLAEALLQIAEQSGAGMEIDFDKIPHDKEIETFENWQDLVLFGGEDYGMIAVVPYDYDGGFTIGKVIHGSGITIKINGKTVHYTKQDIENKLFDHF